MPESNIEEVIMLEEEDAGKVKPIPVSVRLPRDIHETVKGLSDLTGRSMAAQTLQLIELGLAARSSPVISIDMYKRLLLSLLRPPIDPEILQVIAIDCRLSEKEVKKMEAIAHALAL